MIYLNLNNNDIRKMQSSLVMDFVEFFNVREPSLSESPVEEIDYIIPAIWMSCWDNNTFDQDRFHSIMGPITLTFDNQLSHYGIKLGKDGNPIIGRPNSIKRILEIYVSEKINAWKADIGWWIVQREEMNLKLARGEEVNDDLSLIDEYIDDASAELSKLYRVRDEVCNPIIEY